MRKRVLQLGSAIVLLAALAARSATIEQTAATFSFDDTQTFGSLLNSTEGVFQDFWYGNASFAAVPNIEVSSGQQSSTTSSISFTIKAAPGYAFTSVGVFDYGGWATKQPATIDVFADGNIVDDVTGLPLPATTNFFNDSGVAGTNLAGGAWNATQYWFAEASVSSPTQLTIQFSRTLSADATAGGDALIGNPAFGGGLNFSYSAVLIPEPASYAALALGMMMLTMILLKRRA